MRVELRIRWCPWPSSSFWLLLCVSFLPKRRGGPRPLTPQDHVQPPMQRVLPRVQHPSMYICLYAIAGCTHTAVVECPRVQPSPPLLSELFVCSAAKFTGGGRVLSESGSHNTHSHVVPTHPHRLLFTTPPSQSSSLSAKGSRSSHADHVPQATPPIRALFPTFLSHTTYTQPAHISPPLLVLHPGAPRWLVQIHRGHTRVRDDKRGKHCPSSVWPTHPHRRQPVEASAEAA
jgi:hypothetical protein